MIAKKTKVSRFNLADYLADEAMIAAYLTAILEEPSPELYARALAATEEARTRHGLPEVTRVQATFYLDRHVLASLKAHAKRSGVNLEVLINYVLARQLIRDKGKRRRRAPI